MTSEKKIDLKSRVKNYSFWIGLIGVIGGVLLPYFGLAAEDLTTWSGVFDVLIATVKNPFLLVSLILAVMSFIGVLSDPTTPGITDGGSYTTTATTESNVAEATETKDETGNIE
jgi:phi LC3 family holin